MSTLADRVKDQTASTGTGGITLANAALIGFRTFATAFGSGSTLVNYCIDDAAGNWEVGSGTFNGTTGLTRTTVLSSSNANALVAFTTGIKTVYCTAPAALLDTAADYRAANFLAGINYLTPSGNTLGTAAGLSVTLPVTSGGTGATTALNARTNLGVPVASTTTPAALGTAAVGSGSTFARADHVHLKPTAVQIGAAPLASPIFTGTVTVPGITMGATPSIWTAGYQYIELGKSSSLVSRSDYPVAWLTTGSYWNASYNDVYKFAGTYAVQYVQNAATGTHQWNTTSNLGTVGQSVNYDSKMLLDNRGNLLLGPGYMTPTAMNTLHLTESIRPSVTPTCGLVFVEGGCLMYMSSAGTVTQLAPY